MENVAARHRSRERALQVLYQCDVTKEPAEAAIQSFYETLQSGEDARPVVGRDPFMEELALGAARQAEAIDRRISEKAAHWRVDRMPTVDRNILRLAIYELTRKDTPPAVVIDEAVELARRFSGDEAAAFINGVLDAVRKDLVAQA